MRKENRSAYEILKYLNDELDFKFRHIESMHIASQDCAWGLMYESVHEKLGRIKRCWYTLSRPDTPVICTCEMNEDDWFETKCKKFLDKCFEIAKYYDIYAETYNPLLGSLVTKCVIKQGTTLEHVLIEMDLKV